MYIFTEPELKQYIQLNLEAINIVEEGFTKLANNQVEMPPIMRIDLHDQNGEVDVKTAYVKEKDMFAIKISSGFFNNYQLGLPSGNGMMILMSTQTGVPQAILLDNGYLTEVRTAAAGAIASKYLSKKHVTTVGVIGAGSQARFQVRALKLVRDFSKVLVYARSTNRAKKYAQDMSLELGVEVKVVDSAEVVVRNSDTVITTTPATEPIIKAEWLHPGLHITAMGSDAEHKQELEAKVLARADKLVCDKKEQCARLGELHHALNQRIVTDNSPIIELGQLTSKEVRGRENDEQITVCDLTGTGVQDTAIALFAYNEMVKRNAGWNVENKTLSLKN
ncbi:cyclodeaminase (plasmid) [Priestia megaterium]|uniref:Shikimate / quinate 5-dehydrogenase family protein n=1 Tax=Priestia megaterium (strain ATCC 14581 / DSM 32 / CCUG 1817 / JCM 2506 / NBRC 15308 / NCIMB 9376 / NCTC 10342 / NRRL B-14308 / VKM B-512 / Ford 19) TaxID=1348623 RepID=A0A0B6A583_PRIM2|nr:cyclodeaminase [Priestia megaterium]AJI20105.1 shikimate / quinate 5-dehydrogenase family protein [Priestia megaterium NBRC 15308 = ATCC 14581]KFM94730.1 shikimate / quinate 5-dehydrogenase family protein [Priestia megaterium]KGJ80467.1 ectoine utilization protein EutC [Priestia megaterium NBRC 15308 = ATCC 14581]KNH17331.1 ectoine utilization protein EutC [Priestia megaterium]MDR4231585.1 cyclodeaminase [Priestia megaterium]